MDVRIALVIAGLIVIIGAGGLYVIRQKGKIDFRRAENQSLRNKLKRDRSKLKDLIQNLQLTVDESIEEGRTPSALGIVELLREEAIAWGLIDHPKLNDRITSFREVCD